MLKSKKKIFSIEKVERNFQEKSLLAKTPPASSKIVITLGGADLLGDENSSDEYEDEDEEVFIPD